MIEERKIESFTKELLSWWEKNEREFPWRDESRTPYEIFIAEFLLRKTRAESVENIYEDFLSAFPDFDSLREVKRERIEEMLRPLGLQSIRSKALKEIAKEVGKLDGLPSQREELLSLPHVGRYVANATLCFAFGKKVPIVDANVERVVAEVFGKRTSNPVHEEDWLWEFLKEMLPDENYRNFNLALLDLGYQLRTGEKPEFVNDVLQSSNL